MLPFCLCGNRLTSTLHLHVVVQPSESVSPLLSVTDHLRRTSLAQMFNRFRQPPEEPVLSSHGNQSYSRPCLWSLLHPVRLCLHPFLSGTDAAHLMQASHATAALLADYAFVDHTFAYSFPHTAADVKRSLTFYTRYHMRILRICLSADWDDPLCDSERGLPYLPRSLIALTLGDKREYGRYKRGGCGESAGRESDGGWKDDANSSFYQRIRLIEDSDNSVWDMFGHGSCHGAFNQSIPPGALPHSLRSLQFNDDFDQPLQAGSIPGNVEVVQFGHSFNQPLAEGHLPASLTDLSFGHSYNQSLLPGVLPAGLRRLNLGWSYKQPLPAGSLPSQLQQLRFGADTQPILPGIIPPSVTLVRLSDFLYAPLLPGSIPHSVVHLHLGKHFNQPLLPGVLPSSLRELVLSQYFEQPLQPGSLPDGLEVLVFHEWARFPHTLQPGVIPASMSVLSMSREYSAELVTGGIPATVQWLRLPDRYAESELSGVLSSETHVVWWTKERRNLSRWNSSTG